MAARIHLYVYGTTNTIGVFLEILINLIFDLFMQLISFISQLFAMSLE